MTMKKIKALLKRFADFMNNGLNAAANVNPACTYMTWGMPFLPEY